MRPTTIGEPTRKANRRQVAAASAALAAASHRFSHGAKGSDLILVDNNLGDKFQPSAGRLAANLRAAGIDPASVTKVVFTDAYPGHAGDTVLADGKLRAGRIDPWRRGP
jgi:hypothetical protein